MMKVKLIVGFRRDQEHSIDAEEAHKVYYLFMNPEARAVFKNGLAIKGSQIDEIVPDWQGTMGWNPTHALDNDDWNEIRSSGKEREMQNLLLDAKRVAEVGNEEHLALPLSKAVTLLLN
jgi:hypothetical protein